MKKLLIALGSLIALLLVAIVVIPLVVDVDKYRPQIIQAADEHLNGKLDMGKLSLSLWGQIRIEVAGLTLTDAAGNKVVAVSDAYFHVPFSSVFSGAPSLVFKMDKPLLNVVKDKNGKLNLTSLAKTQPGATAPTGGAAQAKPAEPSKASNLPAIATRARLGVEMTHAQVSYKDLGTGLNTQITDLNFLVHDISLSRPMDLELWADLDTRMGKTMEVKGRATMTGKAQPVVSGMALDHFDFSAKVDLDDLDIQQGAVFHKAKGMAMNADLAMTYSEKEAKIDHFNAKFFNAEIKSSGTVTNLAPATPGGVANPVVNFSMKSNDIDLKPWNQLVPMLNDFDLAGVMHLDADANGPSSKLGYKAKFGIVGLTAKAPKLKAQPRFDLNVDVVTDQIDNMTFTMKAPGNELKIAGKVIGFTTPKPDFTVTSPRMDLDQLPEFPSPPAPATDKEGKPVAAAPSPLPDEDAAVEPMRESKSMANMAANIDVDMKMIKAKGVAMHDLKGRMFFRELTGGIEDFSMKLFNGLVKGHFKTDLRPKQPTYVFATSVAGLDLKEAVASQFSMFKNTLLGKLSFDMTGEGASFNPDPAMQNLKAKGSFKVENATFATIDAGKMATEAVNKALDKIAEKIPQAKDKKLGGLNGREQRYDLVSATFTISGGKFVMPDFVAKAAKDQGIDIKGTTTVGLKDKSLDTTWELVDTYNMTKAYDLSTDVSGVHIDHLLSEGGAPVKFPVHAGGTTAAPVYSYTQVPEYLAGVAFKNLSGAVEGKAKAELARQSDELKKKAAAQAEEQAKKALPPSLQNQAQDLGKKLFGH